MIEALDPDAAAIQCSLDNARYHHAKLVQEWSALPGLRIKLHFIPQCIARTCTDRTVTGPHAQKRHSQQVLRYAVQFADAMLSFLREKVPGNWGWTFVILLL